MSPSTSGGCRTIAIFPRSESSVTSRSIAAVDSDRAVLRLVKAHQQAGHRGFAGAARTDDRDRLAGRALKLIPFSTGSAGFVGEHYVVEFDLAARAAKRRAPGRSLISGSIASSSRHRRSPAFALSTCP